MSYEAMNWTLTEASAPNVGTQAVLMALAHRANDWGYCFVSNEKLTRDTKLKDRALRDNVDRLEALGLIVKVRRRRSNGSWKSTGYFVRHKPLEDMIDAIERDAEAPYFVVNELDSLKTLLDDQTPPAQSAASEDEGDNGQEDAANDENHDLKEATTGTICQRQNLPAPPAEYAALESPINHQSITPKSPPGDCPAASNEIEGLKVGSGSSAVTLDADQATLWHQSAVDKRTSNPIQIKRDWSPSRDEMTALASAFGTTLVGVMACRDDFTKWATGGGGKYAPKEMYSPLQKLIEKLARWLAQGKLPGAVKPFDPAAPEVWRKRLRSVWSPARCAGGHSQPGFMCDRLKTGMSNWQALFPGGGPEPWKEWNPVIPLEIHMEYGTAWGWVPVPDAMALEIAK